LLPFSRSTFLESSHGKNTSTPAELPDELRDTLIKSTQFQGPKRPTWHGCGCIVAAGLLVLLVLFFMVNILYWSSKEPKTDLDQRAVFLQMDLAKTVVQPDSITDAISYRLKACMDPSIEGIDTDKIGYYTKTDGNKILVLLQVDDLKNTYTA